MERSVPHWHWLKDLAATCADCRPFPSLQNPLDSSGLEQAVSRWKDGAGGRGAGRVGRQPGLTRHPSPHRMRSTTCSAALTPASGSPTPSPARPRMGRRRAPGTPCWKPAPSQATRRMSAPNSPQLLPTCLQAPVCPSSENRNRCRLPSSWLPPLSRSCPAWGRERACPRPHCPHLQCSSKSLL